eukprot:gnl/TRDRNA2_/TRDRNA2_154459_c0_seq1.p1 gnl/TRDRNA2_/TRDRNA2_154459_c0~~gnl/TRDRNA2_/TRDRNA2_154459_c0_seq1.p1  ORF type:complete len:161 (-),score=51.01 gnl/TRDRNA2_/TRDRNA2_154459_c0_seq1:222-704(-)
MASLMCFASLFLFGMPIAAVEDEMALIQTKLSVVVENHIGDGSGRELPERPVSATYDMEDSEIRTASDDGVRSSNIKNELAEEDALMKSLDMNEIKSYILSQGITAGELEATEEHAKAAAKAKLQQEKELEKAKEHERLDSEAEQTVKRTTAVEATVKYL